MYAFTRAISLAIIFGRPALAAEFVKHAEQWGINGVQVVRQDGEKVEVILLAEHYRKVVKQMRRFVKQHGIKNANVNGEVLAVDFSVLEKYLRNPKSGAT